MITINNMIIISNISHWRGNVHLNDDSNSRIRTLNASCMNLNLVDVCGGQSTAAARRTLPRGPGLSPIGRNMIGLASRFGYIIVKCRLIGVYGDSDHSALASFTPSSFVI